jgi:hypothetical protein
VTLAYNVRSPAEVDAVLAEARAAGATIAREGAKTFWGGYSGAFIDPDGHPWEVAHNPGWVVHNDGRTTLPQAMGVLAVQRLKFDREPVSRVDHAVVVSRERDSHPSRTQELDGREMQRVERSNRDGEGFERAG